MDMCGSFDRGFLRKDLIKCRICDVLRDLFLHKQCLDVKARPVKSKGNPFFWTFQVQNKVAG